MRIRFCFIILVSFFFVSCSVNDTKAIRDAEKVLPLTYTPEVQVNEVNGIAYIYKDGDLFDGKVWASDKSCYLECENGMPMRIMVFYPDGYVAADCHIKNWSYDKSESAFYYDGQQGIDMGTSDFDELPKDFQQFLNNTLIKLPRKN